jgi:gliding motility-associated-like protein
VFQDSGKNGFAIETGGSPICGCGLDSDALFLDGVDDYVSILDDVSNIFNNNFTLSFYVKIENNPGASVAVDLFSLQKKCERDSSITLKYIPSIRECRLDIVKNLSRSTQMNFTLDEGKCWHHIVIVRDRYNYYIYVNERLVQSELAPTDYKFSPNATFSISNSPCLAVNDIRLKGAIENFQIFDKALTDLEIPGLNLFPDVILNSDTTLLMGESLQIATGPTCANNFYWDNISEIDDNKSLTPVITPNASNTYRIYYQYYSCTSVDSISIYIQDPDDLDCEKLLLPNAFTPNDDDINDHFGISNKYLVDKVISFDIYSRIGTRVFHAESKQSFWDGSYLGEKLNPGKFGYMIEYECGGETYQKQGVVNLLR